MAKAPRYSQRQLLEHIVELCELTSREVSRKSLEEFTANRNLADATAYRLQAIGEACSKLEASLRAKHNIPWTEIIGMRQILSHDYLAISYRIVWQTAISNLDELRDACRSLLS